MTNASPLEKDLITQTELWKLRLFLDLDTLWVALIPPVDSEQLIVRVFTIDPAAPSPHKAIENIIYANPLLLSDFKEVTCLINSKHQMAVPPVTPPSAYMALMETAFPANNLEIIATPLGEDQPVMLTGIDAEIKGFLSRTFYNITFVSQFLPLVNHTISPASTQTVITAFVLPGTISVVAGDNGKILLLNSFDANHPETAAYYLLAVRQILKLTDKPVTFITDGHEPFISQLNSLLLKTEANVRSFPVPCLPFLLPQHTIPVQVL